MPESRDLYQIFSREYYWSRAFTFFKKPYYGGQIWHDVSLGDYSNPKIIGKVKLTTESFLWEEEYDYSKEETIAFFKPTNELFKGMRMKFSKVEGEFINQENEVICFDPSVNNKSISCLLVRKKDFISFLRKRKLKIFWTVLGEKLISGMHPKTEIFKRLEISGLYYLDKNKLSGNIISM